MPRSRSILVFGGTGFIGRNLIQTLSRSDEYEVYSVSASGAPVEGARRSFKVSELSQLKDLSEDAVVFHLATERYNSKAFLDTQSQILTRNVTLTSLIFHFCVERGIKEVRQASSVAVYPASMGLLDDHAPIDLNQPAHPGELFYSWSKRWGELCAKLYKERYGINTLSFRLTNPYGPFDSTELDKAHVAPAFVIKALADSAEFEIKGDPSVERDFIYVSDVVDVFTRSLKMSGVTDEFNLCTADNRTLMELAQVAIRASGRQKEIRAAGAGVNPVKSRRATNEKLRAKFEKNNFVSLADGISKTMEWYKHALRR